MNTVHVRVEGRVQGVFFRDCTRKEANTIGLKGWVMNTTDGAVECVLQGADNEIRKMSEWLHLGSPQSIVTSVIFTTINDSKRYNDFEIRYL